ncbi:glutathione binding-like protein [Enhydrobacter sp.]|uniref:glutathione binding-like protein n=1 Tax=Enhydrobacter sp. TaxID=1894999 RepID=UPI002607BAAE|nr:glutathione binding-like protein [Enhydrobacter sp.]WIM12209.1 MAG: Glutathione S-transferase [Enhydrobacter sp.]
MELFASPMACSLASHITALEAGLPVRVRFVKDKKTDEGGDFFAIAANGYVPALRLESGEVLNEGSSVLQYLADRKPEAGLAPAWGTIERYRLIDTLNYLATEVHKKLFQPIFAPDAPAETKTAAKALLGPTLDYIARRLGGGSFLVGDRFTVADAYLVTLLNWFGFVGCDLKRWPTLHADHQNHLQRPAVAQAMGVEMEERKRRAA